MSNLEKNRVFEVDKPFNKSKAENPKSQVYDSILDVIGITPLVKLNKIPKDHGVACDIFAKCEYFNPGGSGKDMVSLSMIQDAQNNGVLNPHTTLVEGTSGNTGIGIALVAAIYGNKCLIVSEPTNVDKLNTMRLLGGEPVLLKPGQNIMDVTRSLTDDYPNHIMLNQFENPVNPRSHYKYTGGEILEAMNEKIDMVVISAGTVGTLTGVGTRIKESLPKCKIVAAEPDGSTMINAHGKQHKYLVEGIGGTTAPINLDKSIIDEVEVVNDEEAFSMARELSRKEGLLCGGSSGLTVAAAIKAAKRLNLGPGTRVVVILPDGIRNYMDQFVTDQWMEAHLFKDPPIQNMKWWNRPITDVKSRHKFPMIPKDCSCEKALSVMKHNLAIIIDECGRFVGAVTKDNFRKNATNSTSLVTDDMKLYNDFLRTKAASFNFQDPVTDHLIMDVYKLAKNGKKGMPTVGRLSRILDITPFVVIGTYEVFDDKEYFIPEGVATGEDILDFIHKHSK